MKALSKLVATAVLLTTLATFPSALIASRHVARPMTATVPHFGSLSRKVACFAEVAQYYIRSTALTIALSGPDHAAELHGLLGQPLLPASAIAC